MRRSSRTGRRLQIGQLNLDLRGIAPGTGEAAARALGPALAAALRQGSGSRIQDLGVGIGDSRFGPGARIDAGRVESPASPDAHDLAARIARRIAQALEPEEQ
jgi:hypothetical protein